VFEARKRVQTCSVYTLDQLINVDSAAYHRETSHHGKRLHHRLSFRRVVSGVVCAPFLELPRNPVRKVVPNRKFYASIKRGNDDVGLALLFSGARRASAPKLISNPS
jgi:hypothetical protein